MTKEKLKNTEAPKMAKLGITPSDTDKKTDSDTKATEKVSFEFSEADLIDFKAWKAQKDEKPKDDAPKVVCEAPEDDKIYRKWKEESQLVKGIFRSRESVGGNVKFCFRKYKWDRTEWYIMFDGETYEVPLGVARHLNQNCNYPVHSHILGADGKPTLDTTGKEISRMNFENTVFAIG